MFRNVSAVNILRLAAAAIAAVSVIYGVMALTLMRGTERAFVPSLTETVPRLVKLDRLGASAFEAATIATQIIAAPEDNAGELIDALEGEVSQINQIAQDPLLAKLPELSEVKELLPRIDAVVRALSAASNDYHAQVPRVHRNILVRVTKLKLFKDKVSREILHLTQRLSADSASDNSYSGLNLYNGIIAELGQIQQILEHVPDLASTSNIEKNERLVKIHIHNLILKTSRIRNAEIRGMYAFEVRNNFIEFIDGGALLKAKNTARTRVRLVTSANSVVQLLNILKTVISEVAEKAVISEVADNQRDAATQISDQIEKRLENFRTIMVAGSFVVVLLIFFLVFYMIENGVVRRLKTLSHQVAYLSSGDLSPRPTVSGLDEFARLSTAVENLRQANISQKRLERELRDATEKAEQAGKLKSDFMSMMSHEVRTPLNAIMGLFEVIEGAAQQERQKLRARNGWKAAESLFGMLTKVLDAARLEAGETELTLEDVPTESLTQYVEAFLEGAISKSKSKIEGRVIVDNSLPSTIRTDQGFLSQIVSNLIDNAVRYTEKGHVEVRFMPWSPDPSKNDQQMGLRLEVEDSGIGIADENVDLIFDRFYQVEGGITRKKGGSGLGLPITKQLAERLGGSIRFESSAPIGTTFIVEIPG